MLKSRTVADRLIERFGLQKLYDRPTLVDTRRVLEQRTAISHGRDGIITVQFEDTDAARAAEIANAYIDELYKLTQTLAVTEAGQRRLFLEKQLKLTRDALADAEVELKKTQEATGLIKLDEQGRAIIDAVAKLRAQIAAKEVEAATMRSFATERNPAYIRTQQELGGAMSHATRSGLACYTSPDERSCLDDVRYLLSFLPSNNMEEPPWVQPTDDPERTTPELVDVIPASPNQPYDMKQVITAVVDDGDFFEYHPRWGMNLVCGFARLDGHPVGIVGNQPQVLAGVLDIACSEKGGRFVRTCDAFNIPLVTFVDVPGFLPGTDQEYGGIIRHGSKLLYAYCESTVPRIQVITRKAYGGAYVVMNSKSIGADLAFAWPSAEIAVMGPQGAVGIIFRKEIESASDPDARRAELIEEYTERFANPYIAAERGYVDDVIDPRETRRVLVRSLEMLRTKKEKLPQRKHGNVPL